MAHNLPPGLRITRRTGHRNPNGFQPRHKESHALQEQLRRIERLDQDLGHYEATSEAQRRLLRNSLARNAFGTASIEGNPLTLEAVQTLIAANPQGKLEPDEREILNWVDLMEQLDDQWPQTVQGVNDLHKRLFDGLMRDAGRLKTQQNYVGSKETGIVTFVPSPPATVRAELQALLSWTLQAPLHPLVRACIFFHEFQGIHPYRDGNGRLGRALFTMFLHAQGYTGIRYAPVDFAFNADRDSYYQGLSEVEHNGYDYTPWIHYLLDVLVHAYQDALRTFQVRQANPNLPERQAAVVEHFVRLQSWNAKRRIKFNDVHNAFPHVPRRSLQRDLAALVDAGILGRTGERRGATYHLRAPA
jgi:Fic family protein